MTIKVLVVGGAGYIGSHMVWLLNEHKVDITVIDDLSTGHADAVLTKKLIIGDIGNSEFLEQVFAAENFDVVMHFASFIQVAESNTNPIKYYRNNVSSTLVLLNAMIKHDVKKLIFSSTAAVYGAPKTEAITEDHPKHPLSPYGRSKLIIEDILEDYDRAYGLKSICLRYFNAAGAHPDGLLGERHDPETHLIPITIKNTILGKPVLINGNDYETKDGTCVRDYVHVLDIADAHWKALVYILNHSTSERLNIGNGNGHSIKDIIAAISTIANKEIHVTYGARREGDPAILVADSKKIFDTLGWTPTYPDILTIAQHAWNWELNESRKQLSHQPETEKSFK